MGSLGEMGAKPHEPCNSKPHLISRSAALRYDLGKQLKFCLKAQFGPQLSNLQAGYSPGATCPLGGQH